jgi:hypothetical protein
MMRAVLPSCLFALCAVFRAAPCQAEPSATTPSAAAVTTDTSTEAVERCVADHESARLSRVREDWLQARSAMTRCSNDGCPLALRSDCRAWLEELTRLLPTLLIVVERDDDRSQPLGLELDGEPLSLPEPLGPIEVLPGNHRLRATLPPHAPIEQEIVLEKGAKNQVVRVRFVREPERAVLPPAAPVPPSLTAPSSRPVPALSYWLGGGALLAFGTSGVLLGSALSARSSARETCAPNCSTKTRDSIDARLLAADVVGAAGVALAGAALFTFITRPVVVESRATLQASFGLSSESAELLLAGRF